jgi:DNA-binding transcriptional ArsR family regulator
VKSRRLTQEATLLRGLDRTLAALADPMRRGAIELLRTGPRRAGELAEALEVSAPRMSQHLRVLRECGLIACITPDDELASDARARVYRLRSQPFSELKSWLTEVETSWSAELAAFKAYAERTRARRRP